MFKLEVYCARSLNAIPPGGSSAVSGWLASSAQHSLASLGWSQIKNALCSPAPSLRGALS
jgi:hypothetical protein